MEIFKLFASILIDNTEANKSISKTGKEAEGLESKLKNGIATATKWAAGIVAGATAIGSAMVGAAKSTASAMDEIDKGSQRMKVSSDSYQELSHAADLCGVSMSDLEKASKKLEGTGLNLDDALNEIYALGTAEERSAKASKLFSDSIAYSLTPMLNASAEEMASMREEAHDLGLVMSEDAVKNGATMNDMFTNVEKSISALKNSLIADFMPYVMEILELVIEYLPIVQEAIKKVLDWIMPYIEPIMKGVISLVKGIFSLINGDFDGFLEGIKDALIKIVPTLLKLGENMFNAVWDGLKNIWNGISKWVSEKVSWLSNKLAFWKKISNEMQEGQVDGSHASGLNYVPYDGYTATLHRGESVMNAGAMDRLMEKIENLQIGGSNQPIELSINLDGKSFAKATYSAYMDESKRQGSSLVMV